MFHVIISHQPFLLASSNSAFKFYLNEVYVGLWRHDVVVFLHHTYLLSWNELLRITLKVCKCCFAISHLARDICLLAALYFVQFLLDITIFCTAGDCTVYRRLYRCTGSGQLTEALVKDTSLPAADSRLQLSWPSASDCDLAGVLNFDGVWHENDITNQKH